MLIPRASLAWIATLTLVLPGICSSVSGAESSVLPWVPDSCNAVAVINVRKVLNSPLGRRAKWSDKVRQAYAEGLLSAPPWVRQVIRATTLGAASHGESAVYSLYTMDQQSVIPQIAKHEMAPVEKIGGKFAVRSPRGVIFIQLASGLLGSLQPSDRSIAARWVRVGAETHKPQLSSYLREAIDASENSSILLAVDLAGSIDQQRAQKWFSARSRDGKSRGIEDDAQQLAALFVSLQGARIAVNVTDSITGRLQLDFGSSVGPRVEAVKAAVLQWLDDAGARVHLLADAKARASGNSFILESPLDDRALHRIVSFIQSPHPLGAAEPLGNAESVKPNAIGSARYYDAVLQLLKSLDRRNQSAQDYEKTAYWHESAAHKIDSLATIGVDPELATWGRDVSANLRALAASLRGVPVEVNQLEKSVRFNATTYYRWYANSESQGPLYFPSWVRSSDNVDDVRAQQDDVVSKNADQRDAIWQMLRNQTIAVAQKIEYRYGIKLSRP